MDSTQNSSILDQIISNQKAEEVAKLNAVEIINELFKKLNDREQDILRRRFGLHGKEKETLENIGSEHKLTRERIRQIEIAAIKKLRYLENLGESVDNLKKVVVQLLEEHGGFMEREFLLNILVNFSADSAKGSEELNLHKTYLDFLLSKLLHEEFEEINDSKHFKSSLKFKYQGLEHAEKIAEELVEKIKEAKKVMLTSELLDLAKDLQSYKDNQDKFSAPNNIDISHIFNHHYHKDDSVPASENKVLYAILRADKNIEQNEFGYWGMNDWPEVKPRTINNKIYLILKNNGKPMHFTEIASKINEIEFDNKKANAATVHNELILDDKYILVGRGMYGLKEWGYKKGAVADVISDILASSDNPLSRDEIINKVMEQRQVKRATIILALMNKDKFERTEEGKYQVKATS